MKPAGDGKRQRPEKAKLPPPRDAREILRKVPKLRKIKSSRGGRKG